MRCELCIFQVWARVVAVAVHLVSLVPLDPYWLVLTMVGQTGTTRNLHVRGGILTWEMLGCTLSSSHSTALKSLATRQLVVHPTIFHVCMDFKTPIGVLATWLSIFTLVCTGNVEEFKGLASLHQQYAVVGDPPGVLA